MKDHEEEIKFLIQEEGQHFKKQMLPEDFFNDSQLCLSNES
jgi:hypothetical protein